MRHWIFAIAVLASSSANADSVLNEKTAQQFVKNFYQAIQKHDEQALDKALADDVKIKVKFDKMQQSFTLTRAEYLQQIKAAWHFAKKEDYDIKDMKFVSTQVGLSANIIVKVKQMQLMLDEKAIQNQEVNLGLLAVDDQLKIVDIKTKTDF